jgi:hypothetical protein
MQGPPGAASTVPGPEGPQGPAGPNQINSSNIYFRDGPIRVVPSGPNQSIESFASCDPGDIIIEGGQTIRGATGTIQNFLSFTSGPVNSTHYRVEGVGNNIAIDSFVMCFNNP